MQTILPINVHSLNQIFNSFNEKDMKNSREKVGNLSSLFMISDKADKIPIASSLPLAAASCRFIPSRSTEK